MQGIFDPRFTTHFRDAAASGELCRVRITRVTGEASWSPETGTVAGTEITLYEGTARWQSIGRPTKRDFVGDHANFNTIRVQISFEGVTEYQTAAGIDLNFQPNDKVVMVENASNPSSVGDTIYVWGNATSSNAWHHTLTGQQNMKHGE